jgi:hypothetical protein
LQSNLIYWIECSLAVSRQLVVVHGVVMERTQELKAGTGVYMERCCPNSYGVVVRQPYDPIQHVGEDVVIDPRDKKKWAEQQIHWFIRQVRGAWRPPVRLSC